MKNKMCDEFSDVGSHVINILFMFRVTVLNGIYMHYVMLVSLNTYCNTVGK
jgi:hypothetical protein